MAKVQQNIGASSASPYFAGDDLTVTFTIAADITGAAVRWEAFAWPSYIVAKRTATAAAETTVAITKVTGGGGITVTDATTGTFQVTILPADTTGLAGAYYHEAQVTLATGKVYTVASGLFLITDQRVV